ncbi:MAG: baseplate J/gp47 family protein [Helicobacteraceae bacterium]|jgi:phage-related baseplate assembly protein|nr:baseplate J/gp47 family protein [Helicobacteraceae bacterium]
MVDLSRVAVPDILETFTYGEIKSEVEAHLKTIFDVTFLESDSVRLVVEALIYREALLRARVNGALKAAFVPSATGNDLDNLAVAYGIARLENETDTAFRNRILMSLDRPSTAGAAGAYRYYATSADARVKEVLVTSPAPGEVLVTYYAEDDDAELRDKVEAILNADDVRPLTDIVTVAPAERMIADIVLAVELFLQSDQTRVKNEILAEFAAFQPPIGEDLPLSKIIAMAHRQGVYRVGCNLTSDIIVSDLQVVYINSLEINFAEAAL